MNKKRKTLYILSAVSGIFILLVLSLLLPKLVQKDLLREKVLNAVSGKTEGSITFHDVDIAFFPLPHVGIHQIRADFPEGHVLTLRSLKVYPKLLSLLFGKIRISRIRAESPELNFVYLPKKPSDDDSGEAREKKISSTLALLPHDLNISIKGGRIYVLKGAHSVLTVREIDSKIEIHNNSLSFRARGSSDFVRDFVFTGKIGDVSRRSSDAVLVLEGRDINLPAARKTAFSLAPGNQVAENIFAYLKGGEIPFLSLKSRGDSIDDLWKIEHMVLNIEMNDGTVFVPGAQLEFSEVQGLCSISEGVLEARDLRGMLGSARLERGVLRAGLKGKDAPFHFEAHTVMDFAMTSRLIKRFLKEPPFPLNNLQPLEGPVEGKIVLGESMSIFKEWKSRGFFQFHGNIKVHNGPSLDLEVSVDPSGFAINQLHIRDKISDAEIKLKLEDKVYMILFSGDLSGSTVEKLIGLGPLTVGSVKGNFDAHIDTTNVSAPSASGNFTGQSISILWKEDLPLSIEHLNLNAAGKRVSISSGALRVGKNAFGVKGFLDLSSRGITPDVDISAEYLEWESIKALMPSHKKEAGEEKKDQKRPFSGMIQKGSIRVQAKSFTLGNMRVSPLKAHISLVQGGINIQVNEALLCGISMPGTIRSTDNTVNLDFSLSAHRKKLKPSISCLTDGKSLATGVFNFDGTIKAEATADDLVRSIHGSLHLDTEKGRIYRGATLAKIFSVLNVSGIFEGGVPDLVNEGFVYHTIVIDGVIKHGKIVFTKAVMEAPSMTMVSTGEIDLGKKRIDMKVLASPLKSVDNILSKIPILRDITGNTLVSLPVSVTGDLKNPSVSYLPLSSVGSGLVGILERTVKLPVKLIKPELPEEKHTP
jgi:hypothetical protein